jgi:pimeloyl-ACP methyl ester carboxylesterase
VDASSVRHASHGMKLRRRILLLGLLGSSLALSSCALLAPGVEPPSGPTLDGFEPLTRSERGNLGYDLVAGAAGEGAQRVLVVMKARAPRRQPVVIFLHGWGTTTISAWEPWVGHLARSGVTVVYPVYQSPPFTARRSFRMAFENMIAGVRNALSRVEVDKKRLVVAGVSAGGALATDYAASAKRLGLPRARVVYAVYPARSIFDGPVLLHPQPGSIPATTRVVVIASKFDEIAGTKWSRRMVRRASEVPASRKELRFVQSWSVADHGAPGRDSPLAQETFWRPLDRLIDEP